MDAMVQLCINKLLREYYYYYYNVHKYLNEMYLMLSIYSAF
jgi:hypothetical protein